jgi:hypothetical protein
MYIANCTNQLQVFSYRQLGAPAIPNGANIQEIEIGSQERLPDDTLTPEEIDYIVNQHARYGMIHVSEIDRTRPFVGLCWDTKPISISKIKTVVDHNNKVLTLRGMKLRQQAAVATSDSIEKTIVNTPPDQRYARGLNAIDLSITEEEHKSGLPYARDSDDTSVNETITVSRQNPQGPPITEKAPRASRRGR